MNQQTSARLDATSRVAFSAYLHDLGKLAERARIPYSQSDIDTHKQMYCPRRDESGRIWYSHVHAAYTALAALEIEQYFPAIKGGDVFPYSIEGGDVSDSLINASAQHHKPTSLLQWITATADRVASGFEREAFEEYNKAEDSNHYRSRMLSLFQQIDKATLSQEKLTHRYPLKPLSVSALFPVPESSAVPADDATAQQQYLDLWDYLKSGIQRIPAAHRKNWPLWLDHFDALWLCATHAIPSATAGGVRPDVSLYDHSRTTAALAASLWRYHEDSGHDQEKVRSDLISRTGEHGWDEQKFLLVQGDFWGIQDFIFASGGATQKNAAKLLRGRSFQVGLMTECAALRVLEALDLPPTSQVINAAGKFLIVAPNTDESRQTLQTLRAEFDAWFLQETCGMQGIGLAWTAACPNNFIHGKNDESAHFRLLMQRLFQELDRAKLQRFQLCSETAPTSVRESFLNRFNNEWGVCELNGLLPADGEDNRSKLARDQVAIGEKLTHCSRYLISRTPLKDSLQLSLFGYAITFVQGQESRGDFGALATSGDLRRALDFGLAETTEKIPFEGYARRFINTFVARFTDTDQLEAARGKYTPAGEGNVNIEQGGIKSLSHLACEARTLADNDDDQDGWQGVAALAALKGDVDNLGHIFQHGIGNITFARMATLSRQFNLFFAFVLPQRCQEKFANTYTVFAGGDDFFLIGPWRQQIQLAAYMRELFARYVENEKISFSSALIMSGRNTPIRALADMAEEALDRAKQHVVAPDKKKDAVFCLGQVCSWPAFYDILKKRDEIRDLRQEYNLSTGYLYGLLGLSRMAGEAQADPAKTLWRAHFGYRTRRYVTDKLRRQPGEDDLPFSQRQKTAMNRLFTSLGEDGIGKFRATFVVALSLLLYAVRK